MQKKPQSIIALAIAGLMNPDSITVQARNVIPHGKLTIDAEGFTISSGIASGGQPVHSLGWKVHRDHYGKGKHGVELKFDDGSKKMITSTAAEVMFAQSLPTLGDLNKGTGAAS